MKNKRITALSASLIMAFFNISFNASANDCSLYSSSKKSIKCLQDKVKKLEKKLKKSKNEQLTLPKGAIVKFATQECPDGWSQFQSNTKGIVNLAVDSGVITCKKS